MTIPPIDPEPAGLSTVTTVGLLILAIGALAAVSAWLLAWYRGRQDELEAATEGSDAPDPEPEPPDPV